MTLYSPSCLKNHAETYVWNPTKGNIIKDCKAILKRCKQYEDSNKILNVEQEDNGDKVGNYIRLIELLGRYGLYNVKFADFPLSKFSNKALYLCRNKRFLQYWFYDIIGGTIIPNDIEQLKKITTILAVIKPRGLEHICLENNVISTSYQGIRYSITSDVRGWEDTSADLPSFSINTRNGGVVCFYLVEPGIHFSGHASKMRNIPNRHFSCRYYNQQFEYDGKTQKLFSDGSLKDTSLYLTPTNKSIDVIFLGDIEDYLKSYAYDDPSKGFGTRLFYFDEANLINTETFPTDTKSLRILTQISNEEIAIHNTPSKYIRKTVDDCGGYNKVLTAVPRVLVIDKSKFDQLQSENIIRITKCF